MGTLQSKKGINLGLAGQGRDFVVDRDTTLILNGYLTEISSGIVVATEDEDRDPRSTGDVSTTDSTEAILSALCDASIGIELLFADMADGMMVVVHQALNGDYDNYQRLEVANRTALRSESFIKVRWPWIIPQTLVQILALVLVVMVILNTRRDGEEACKGSTSASLFHGIDEDSRQQMLPLNDVQDMDDMADSMVVQLVDRGSGWGLVVVDNDGHPKPKPI